MLNNRAFIVALAFILTLIVVLFNLKAQARDDGQWDETSEITQWYRSLMRPDAPESSCCGIADAYWCDNYYARNGKAYCRITDDRPDEPRHRRHVPVGTEIEIPPEKLKWDRANPTGHSIVFLSQTGYVFCFVQNGGV